jgi:hypothetical protein
MQPHKLSRRRETSCRQFAVQLTNQIIFKRPISSGHKNVARTFLRDCIRVQFPSSRDFVPRASGVYIGMNKAGERAGDIPFKEVIGWLSDAVEQGISE